MTLSSEFPPCPVCQVDRWTTVYEGPIRDGTFGQSRPARIARCTSCGIDRLAEDVVLGEQAYRGDYRTHVGQDHDLARHFVQHDELARFTLDVIWPRSFRDKTVVDVGCGGGSLLDHIRGLPREIIAVDPDEGFGPLLAARGYRWYRSLQDAAKDVNRRANIALAIQVIEHVVNPVQFLREICDLVAADSVVVVSTPNRDDILMKLLPADFPAFFYRTQHRWYFDAESLALTARAAGYEVAETVYAHRYGMANALLWLRERKPSGRDGLPGIDTMADKLWSSYLEQSGQADNLYMILKPA
jgi:SAM-dependent methyltransferase